MIVLIIVFLLVGKKMSFEIREFLKEERNFNSNGGIINFIKNLLLIVFLIEILGVLILVYGFFRYYLLKKLIFYGLFYLVLVFCNVGFFLFINNLEDFRYDKLISLIILFLIILGGIGFVIVNLFFIIKKKKLKNLSLILKFVLFIIFFFLIFGIMLFLVFEYNNLSILKGMNFVDKIINLFF